MENIKEDPMLEVMDYEWPCECCGDLYPITKMDEITFTDGTYSGRICADCAHLYWE